MRGVLEVSRNSVELACSYSLRSRGETNARRFDIPAVSAGRGVSACDRV